MIIDKKLEGVLTGVLLIYFFNISLYSLLPDIIYVPKVYGNVFYWCNNTLMLSIVTFIFSKFVITKRTKMLIKGTSLFFIILGLFQIIMSIGVKVEDWVWALLCPCYIIFLLITYRLCHQKKQ